MGLDTRVIYRIDALDRIVFVNEGWEQFARANDSSDFTAAKVLNRSLWDFINDRTTRYLYGEILRQVRSNKSMAFNFRCDSPQCRHYLEMTVTAHADDVQFETRTLKIEPRDFQPILAHDASHSDELVVSCGWCKKIRTGDADWKEVEEAVVELNVFERESLPQITHGMCGDCFMQMSETIIEKARAVK